MEKLAEKASIKCRPRLKWS